MALNNKNFSTIRNGRAVGNRTDTMVYNDYNSVSSFVYNKKKKPTDDTTGGATAGKDVFLPRFKKLVFIDLKSRLNVSGREIDALMDLGLTEEEAYRIAFKDAKEEDVAISTKNVLKKLARFKKAKKVYREDFKAVGGEALEVVRFIREHKNLKAIMFGYTDSSGKLPSSAINSDEFALKLMEMERKSRGVVRKLKEETGGSSVHRLTSFEMLSANGRLEELLDRFSPEKFYSISNYQLLPLLQEVASAYAGKQGYQAPKVTFGEFNDKKGYMTHGSYFWGLNQININKKYLEIYERAKQCKNEEYPLRLLQTIIHETTHFLQDQQNLEAQITPAGFSNQSDFVKYLSDFREMDARKKAQSLLDEMVRAKKIKVSNRGYLKLSAETKMMDRMVKEQSQQQMAS